MFTVTSSLQYCITDMAEFIMAYPEKGRWGNWKTREEFGFRK
jgi:hypothetical protein